MPRHFVYILRCADQSLYTGYTTNLTARVAMHNEGKAGAKFTRARRPVALVHAESFRSKSKAMSREAEIKQLSRREKLALIGEQKAGPSGLQEIPGVGPSIAQDLLDLGYKKVSALRKQDPERMYARLMALRGKHIDRCVLYAFRCAVYYASHKRHDADKLKWWHWKD